MYYFACISFAIRPSGRKSAIKLTPKRGEDTFGTMQNVAWIGPRIVEKSLTEQTKNIQ